MQKKEWKNVPSYVFVFSQSAGKNEVYIVSVHFGLSAEPPQFRSNNTETKHYHWKQLSQTGI